MCVCVCVCVREPAGLRIATDCVIGFDRRVGESGGRREGE